MYKYLCILFALFAAVDSAAQQMPERSLVRQGNRAYNQGSYERAIDRFEKALEASPDSYEAAYNLGNALYKAERFDSAELTIRKIAADTLRPRTEQAEAFYNLGNAQFRQKKYKEALESYKQSLRLNPSDMEAKYNYAYTKRLLDRDKSQQQNQQNQQDQQNQDQQDKGKEQQDQKQKEQSDKDKKQDKDSEQQNDNRQNDSDSQKGQDDNPQNPSGKNDREENGDTDESTPSGISPQEQQQMLDAIQAQEDKTQEKVKDKLRGAVFQGKRNW